MSNETETTQALFEDTHAQGGDRTMHGRSARKRHPGVIVGAMAVALMALITSAASASASDPNSLVTSDSNADGIIDGYGLDRWADGTFDVVANDLDQNGWLEAIMVDFNNDGTFEVFAADSQQNGVLDYLWVDTDLDGWYDRVIRDSNEDGYDDSTTVGYVGGSTIANPSIGIVGGQPTFEFMPLVLTLAAITGQATHGTPDSDGDKLADDRDPYPNDPYRW